MSERKTINYRPIPFVSSRNDGFDEWIESNRNHPIDDKKKIIKYLKSGYCVAAVPGIERDPFNDNQMIPAPPNIRWDGVWVWVETLVYWVESVDLELPEDFLNHARKNKYKISSELSVKSDEERPWHKDGNFFLPR